MTLNELTFELEDIRLEIDPKIFTIDSSIYLIRTQVTYPSGTTRKRFIRYDSDKQTFIDPLTEDAYTTPLSNKYTLKVSKAFSNLFSQGKIETCFLDF